MAWFGEGLSSLKGQLSNFTKEVLAEGRSEVTGGDPVQFSSSQRKSEELEALCASQELEISRLKDQNDSFRNRLEEFEVPLPEQGGQNGSTESWWSVQHWKLPKTSNIEQSPNDGVLSTEDLLQRQLVEKEEERKLLQQQLQKLSSEVKDAMTYKDKWQAAVSEVKELEDELRKVQHQLLEQVRNSQANTSELREEVEHTLQQLLNEPSDDKMEFLHSRQDTVNHIIHLSKKSREAELQVKKLQNDGKKLSEDVASIIQKLGDPEEQEIIHGALKALELENQVLKLRNAQLEDTFKGKFVALTNDVEDNIAENSELILGINAEHNQMQSEWAEEKLELENNMSALYEKLEKYEEKLNVLEKEKSCTDAELGAMTAVVQDLEMQLSASRDEISTLTTSLEELDQQHQDATNQILAVKKSLQNERDQLVQELKLSTQKQAAAIATETQTDNDVLLELLIYDKVVKLLTFEIPEEFSSKRSNDGKGSRLIGALVKMSAECKWQRDTLERKVACLMKELRECCEERDALAELSQGLPPIPENSEEVEVLGQKVAALEEKVAVLTESRSNLEADAERLREESCKLASMLQASEESLRNERNVNTEAAAKLNIHISELQEEIRNLQKSLQDADQKRLLTQALLDDVKVKLDHEIQVNTEIKLVLQECEVEKSTLQQELDELKLVLQECEVEKSTLQQELDQVSAKVAAESFDCVEALKKDKANLQEHYNSELCALQRQTADLESHKSELELEVQLLKQQLSKVRDQNEGSSRLCDDLKLIISAKDSEINDLKLSVEECHRVANETKHLFEELNVKHNCVEEELHEALLSKTQIEKELKEREDKIVEQVELLANLQDNLTSKDQQCNDLVHLNAELKNNYSEVEEERSDWREKFYGAEDQLKEVLKMKASLEEESKRMAELERGAGVRECLHNEVTALSEALDNAKQQLREAQEHLFEMELKVREGEQRASEQNDRVVGLEVAVSVANDHLEAERQKRLQVEAERSQQQQTLEQATTEAVKWRNMYDGAIAELEKSKQAVELNRMNEKLHAHTEHEESQQQEFVREQLQEASRTKQSRGDVQEMGTDSNITEEKCDIGKKICAGIDISKVHREVENFIKNLDVGEATVHVLRKKLTELLSASMNLELLLETKRHEIDSLKVKLVKLEEDNDVLSCRHQFQIDETSNMAKETITRLSEIIKERDSKLEVLAQKNDSLTALLHSASVGGNVKSEELARLHGERDELVRAVKQKHEESVHYHAEIQRLSALLNQELRRSEESRQQQKGLELQFEDKQKTLLNTQNELISVKQRLEKLEALAQSGESFQTVAAIQRTVGELEVELAKKEEIIKKSSETLVSCENVIQTKDRELNQLKSQVTHLQAHVDMSLLREQSSAENLKVVELESKLMSVSDALRDEQTKRKHFELEVQELREKESALRKELERLRLHLVGVEDSYTQEVLKMEAQIKDLKQQVLHAEECMKNSSTAYTSVSIRANQQVETLQEQVRLILQQRDEIQQKLSSTEDQMERQAAALCNLQAVLKQFQKDKEREIMFETERIRQQLQSSHTKETELASEIKALKGQLSEAKDGLNAAARLGEQLDRKTDLVATLKEEVSKLKQELCGMETRVQTATQSSEGKVDRSLVKNLFLGYFLAPNNSRAEVLRVVATVLDFSEEERTRMGLAQGMSKGVWPQSGGEARQSPSLSEAFIKFLENESQPVPQLRLLPERKISQSSEPGKAENAPTSRRTPLLLHDVQLPSFSQFPVGRNSSSILKDVLKDS